MFRSLMIKTICLLAVFFICSPAWALELAKDGVPLVKVITSGDATEVKAAEELAIYIEKITGARLPVINKKEESQTGKIVISNGKSLPEFGLRIEALNPEGFAIKTQQDNLAILGKDAAGTEFAVYYLLQKYCGVRWFFPGELGEVVPRNATVRLPEINEVQSPDFERRLLWIGGEEGSLWMKRNLLGSSMPNHTFYIWVPPEKYFAEHPEYFALVNGKRKRPDYMDNPKLRNWGEWQICTSNPDVIKLVAEGVCRRFAESPKTKVMDISPNDGGGFCECERCRALDTEPGVLTDRIITFANAVADEVRKTYPDKYVKTLAYSFYEKPPARVKVHPGVIIEYAYSAANRFVKESDRVALSHIEGWAAQGAHLWIYEYLISESWPHFAPRIITHSLGWEIPYFKKTGVRGYVSQSSNDWAMNGPHYYLVSRLLWDSSLNVDTIMDEYYRLLFGKAAGEIKGYFDCLEQAWSEGMSAPGITHWNYLTDVQCLQLYNDRVLEECRNHFQRAEQLADSEEISRRIKMFRTALTFTENHIKILKALKKVNQAGISVSYSFETGKEAMAPSAIKEVLVGARQVLEEQLAFIETQKTKNTLGYDWIYDPGTRGERYIPTRERQLELVNRYLVAYGEKTGGIEYKLPDLWDFRLDKNNRGLQEEWFKKEWPAGETDRLKVTAFWNNQGYKDYSGVAWYRAEFLLPGDAAGRETRISFPAVDAEANVYINGKLAGHHPYTSTSWETPFEFEVTGLVKPGAKNIIVVRVDGHDKLGGIWQPVKVFSPVSPELILNGNFNDGLKDWGWNPVFLPDSKIYAPKPSVAEPGRDGKGKCIGRTTPGQITQKVALKPGSKYQASGWIKTEGSDKTVGGDIYINFAPGVNTPIGSLDEESGWKYFERVFEARGPLANVTLRLRGNGTAYFDDISLTEVNKNNVE